MTNRVPRGNKAGGQFAPSQIGRSAPKMSHKTKMSKLIVSKAVKKLAKHTISSAGEKFEQKRNYVGNGLVVDSSVERCIVTPGARVLSTRLVEDSEVEDDATVNGAEKIVEATISGKAQVKKDSVVLNSLVTDHAYVEKSHVIHSQLGGFFRSDCVPFDISMRKTPDRQAVRRAEREASSIGLNIISGVRLSRGYVYGNADIRNQTHIVVRVVNGVEYTRYRTKTGGPKRQWWYGARKPKPGGGWSVQAYYDTPPKRVQGFFN